MVQANLIDDDYVDRFTDKSSRLDDSDYIYVPDRYADDDDDYDGDSSRDVKLSRPNTKLPSIQPAFLQKQSSDLSATGSSGKHKDNYHDDDELDFSSVRIVKKGDFDQEERKRIDENINKFDQKLADFERMFTFINDDLDFSKLNKINLLEQNRNSKYIADFKLDRNQDGDENDLNKSINPDLVDDMPEFGDLQKNSFHASELILEGCPGQTVEMTKQLRQNLMIANKYGMVDQMIESKKADISLDVKDGSLVSGSINSKSVQQHLSLQANQDDFDSASRQSVAGIIVEEYEDKQIDGEAKLSNLSTRNTDAKRTVHGILKGSLRIDDSQQDEKHRFKSEAKKEKEQDMDHDQLRDSLG